MSKPLLPILIFFISICFTAVSQNKKDSKSNGSKENSYEGLIAKANEFYFKGEFGSALPLYAKALKDTSTSAILWQRLAYSNFMTGDLGESLSQYNTALSLYPNPFLKGLMMSRILEIYEKQMKSEEAVSFLKKVSEDGFTGLKMVDTLKVFDSFRGTFEFKLLLDKIMINAYPCLGQPHRNDFDFWVGEWDVYHTGTQNIIGHSVITKPEGGCIILESWEYLLAPITGNSLNYYDPLKEKWEQIYVGSDGIKTTYLNGEYNKSKMSFDYQSTTKNQTTRGYFIFYNINLNEIRQYQDIVDDAGKVVKVTTDLTYKRRK